MKAVTLNRWLMGACVLLLAAGRLTAAENWTRDDAAHLLRRAGFGGTPGQIESIHALGRFAAIEYLLGGRLPAGVAAPFAPAALAPFQPGEISTTDAQQANRQRAIDIQQLRFWWLGRMISTDRPLEEKMALFWHSLLTTGAREVREPKMLADQNELFRAQATGNYKKLIEKIVHDPAMLRFLNAEQNVKAAPNENFARELLELFTLGEGNGYTEKDISEIACAFSGASIVEGAYFLRPMRHDDGAKTIFGASGRFGPDDVPELIFRKSQPAKYLARRLWFFFASPNPTPADISPIEQALLRSNYELKPALRTMFQNPAFYSDRVKFSLIKSPTELLVGTMRTLELPVTDQALRFCLNSMEGMGQVLFQPPNVRGWQGGESWITSATLFTRYNTTSVLALGNPTQPPDASAMFQASTRRLTADNVVDGAALRFLGRPLDASKREALVEVFGAMQLRPGTPMTDRRIRQVIALMLSTPEYQVE